MFLEAYDGSQLSRGRLLGTPWQLHPKSGKRLFLSDASSSLREEGAPEGARVCRHFRLRLQAICTSTGLDSQVVHPWNLGPAEQLPMYVHSTVHYVPLPWTEKQCLVGLNSDTARQRRAGDVLGVDNCMGITASRGVGHPSSGCTEYRHGHPFQAASPLRARAARDIIGS